MKSKAKYKNWELDSGSCSWAILNKEGEAYRFQPLTPLEIKAYNLGIDRGKIEGKNSIREAFSDLLKHEDWI